MKFDEYQEAFISAPLIENSVTSLQAVAGAGKTTCSVMKIKQAICEYEYDPESIIFITFSNKSARDIASKYKKLTGFSARPRMSTIHGLALHFFKHYFNTSFSLLNEWGTILMIRDALVDSGVLASYPEIENSKRDHTILARNILNVTQFLKSNLAFDEIVTNDTLVDFDYKDFNEVPDCMLTKEHFNKVFGLFELYKTNSQVKDYSDIIYQLTILLKSNPNILAKVKEDYPLIFVDEAQDLDPMLFQLIFTISSHSQLYLIYDKSQTIYGFRWASPEFLEDIHLNSKFGVNRTFSLRYNYRSTKNIVDMGNRVRKIMKNDITALSSNPEVKGSVSLSVMDANKSEGTQIVNKILAMREEGIYDYSDMAVIARTNSYIKTIVEPALAKEGIPYTLQTKNRKKLFDKPLVQAYFSMIGLIVDPTHINPLLELAIHVKGIGESTVSKLRRHNMLGVDIFSTGQTPSESNKLVKLQNLQTALASLDTINLPVSSLAKVLEKFTHLITTYCPEKFTTVKEVDIVNKALTTMVFSYHEDFGYTDLKEVLKALLLDFIDIDTESDPNSVSLLTIHGSKGLEWPVVFAGDQSRWMVQDEDVFDESCILYVQLSRAINRLYMIHSNVYIDRKFDSRESSYTTPYTKLKKQLGI